LFWALTHRLKRLEQPWWAVSKLLCNL